MGGDTPAEEATQDDVHEDGAGNETKAQKPKPRGKKTAITIDHPQHGKITIRHMRAVELDAAALADSATKQVRIQLAKVGQWAGHSAGPFEMSAKTFAEIVANFNATANRAIPIDFEHSSESDPTSGSIPTTGAPAQGWIVDLHNMGDGGLWATVEWGDLAADYIKSGSYRYISPTVHFAARDRVSGKSIGARVTSAALTNRPFLDGMQRLAASDRDIDAAGSDAGDGTGKAEGIKMDEKEVGALKDELKATKTALETATKALEETKTQLATMSDWKAKRDDADIASEVDVAFDTYKDARKLTDANRASMIKFRKSEPEAFAEMYPRVKSSEQHLMRDLTGKRSALPLPAVPAIELPVFKMADVIAEHRKAGKSLEDATVLAFNQSLAVAASAGR